MSSLDNKPQQSIREIRDNRVNVKFKQTSHVIGVIDREESRFEHSTIPTEKNFL
jgi:hypothetical protein